jgi:hypothetical protein
MPDWQERITRETAPDIRAEHELRYRMAAPLITSSAVWADLGCGNGVAAGAALGSSRPRHTILVDMEQEIVAQAARELHLREATSIAGDLTDFELLRRLGEALMEHDGERVVTCFEVVEHLSTFVPLLDWAGALAREGAATVLISVPNDAFWAVQNPHHQTLWSEGSFEELRRLLPEERTLLRQVALSGSALAPWDASRSALDVTVTAGGEATVASHFIAAFGPRHVEVWRGAIAVQTDLLEQRRWERQRESDAAVAQEVRRAYEGAVKAQDETIAKQQEELRHNIAEFDDWRAYIHQLEGELGRPLAGSAEAPPPSDKATRRE